MKTRHHKYAPLTAAQIKEYRALRHAREIAYETRNIGRAHELGQILRQLRDDNVAYKFID